jgi:hypothetical protein
MSAPLAIAKLAAMWRSSCGMSQHLPYYLDEFTFRFSRRTSRARGLLFYRLFQQAAGTDPHPLSELIAGTGNDWDELTNH